MKEKIEQCQEELRELEDEFEDKQGEKNQKYRELRQKEVQIDEFLNNFDRSREEEAERIERLHVGIVENLNLISKNAMQLDKTMTTPSAEDYSLGSTQKKSRSTTSELQEGEPTDREDRRRLNVFLESVRLQEELFRLDEVEIKAQEELGSLKDKMDEMQHDIQQFGDIDTLRQQAEGKQSVSQ